MKKILIMIFLSLLIFLISCNADTVTNNSTTEINSTTTQESFTTNNTTTQITTVEPTDIIGDVSGLEDTEIIRNHYFNSLKGVSVLSAKGRDLTSLLSISGYVDYGTVGDYVLDYNLSYNGDELSLSRTISVVEGAYVAPEGTRPIALLGNITMGEGSYSSSSNSNIEHPINPSYIESDLLDKAIPSSGWWTSLLVQNYGGGNGIYTNPLRAAFSNDGLEITNPQDGFVQYWYVNEVQTMAQFPIGIKDLFLRSTDLNSGYTTKVIDYSDSSVKVSMRNTSSTEDELVITLVQGSPYIFAETANKDALTLKMEQGANVEFYDLTGTKIEGTTHLGEGIVVKYVQRHSGYDCSLPANVGQPEYSDKYYLVNTPSNSTFSMNNNLLSMSLGDGNYLSLAAINDLSEVSFYHEKGYSMIINNSVNYEIDYQNSLVYTDYIAVKQNVDGNNQHYPLQALMPHHYKYSDLVTTDYSYRTVRGTLKVIEGNYFQTELAFNGLLPGYTLPDNTEFSSVDTVAYLEDLDSRTEILDLENFLNDEGPYWNSKASYPLAQAIIIADQLDEDILKAKFIEKLRYLLSDWYTYSDSSDERFLHYNNAWGSVYYSNNDFGTATELSDHSFTHGYLIYASSVLAMYDGSFIDDYGLMVDFLLDDYMHPTKSSAEFDYLRNFDPWAGHSWAHGFGTFAEGNNLESTSEGLNSWNAGYLWALATGDTDRMEAAIYGFTTEISSIKEYWFDYDDENWDPKFGDNVDVAGIVWGGKHDYATWFGANPTFIYGIQWLPTGEFLTNYALNDDDYDKFSSIYATYLEAKDGTIDTWYSNMWAIQAIIDPQIAITQFNESLILNDDYPSELVGSYWMIHALESLGRRNSDVWMELLMGVTSTVYETEAGSLYAMIWNSSSESKTVSFYNSNGLVSTVVIEGLTFDKFELN